MSTVDSTQNIAQRLAEDDALEGTLVIAEQQTSGRGRMGRQMDFAPRERRLDELGAEA